MGGQERGPDGKFKAKAEGEAPATKQADKTADTAQADPNKIPDQANGEPQKEAGNTGSDIEVPNTWSKEAREKVWSTLTPEAKAYIVRREMEMSNGARKLSTEIETVKREYGEVGKAVETHRSRWALNGITPSAAIGMLVELDALAQKDPRAFIQECAKRAGIQIQDLGGDGNGAQPKPPTQNVDEVVRSILAQERETAGQSERAGFVDRFLSDKDKFPFADQVLDDMPGYVGQIRRANPQMPHEQVLELAYQRAVEFHPETSKVVEAERRAKKMAEDAERARKAQNASGSIRPGGGASLAPVAAKPGESAGDTLRRQFANAGASV